MNTFTLDELINRYEESIEILYGDENDEIFKWRALRTFQQEWFSVEHKDFISRFKAATKDFLVFIDNSRMHPRTGVEKLYEKEPKEVERLFCDVLFAEDNGDLAIRQDHMDSFIDGMEKLRRKYFPANWSYKQDRHSASTYLAMYSPSDNYVYKYGEAEAMAVYGEFGFDIGSGINFNLQHYYKMCDDVVEQLKKHDSLLKTHFDLLDEKCEYEQSLHLLAFDLLYCSKAYGFYKGLSHVSKKEAIKQAKEIEKQKESKVLLQKKVETLYSKIEELELSLPDISDIALMNVEVYSRTYGNGIVIEQEYNKIKVQFENVVKSFKLEKKFSMLPSFENDKEVVAVFSEHVSISEQIDSLRKELESLKD